MNLNQTFGHLISSANRSAQSLDKESKSLSQSNWSYIVIINTNMSDPSQ